ncbi:PREDICTED: uncharacterized protein LOC105589215 [Cercocebus atys]|uniref:uncharacterized protein LOC105589215 n=1 Tax=Cercocebus atys TaxID=9531 RepID=UPI0005F4D8D7|nr:PREDICTED: uncharacterized protein LOC105589215 [Cercocebus atys]
MEQPCVRRHHWRTLEPGGGADSPGFLTGRASPRSRARSARAELSGRLRREDLLAHQLSGERRSGRRAARDTQRTRWAAAAKGGGKFGTATPPRARRCHRRPGLVRGRADNAAGPQSAGRLRSPDPNLTVTLLTQRPPGIGAPPSFRQPAKEVCPRPRSPATCKPGKVCGASAGRRDAARPTRPRSPRVTFSTRRQPGPQRGRRGLRGGPESVRGLPHLGLREH